MSRLPLALSIFLSTGLSGCALLPFNRGPIVEVAPLEAETASLGGDIVVTTGDLEAAYDELAVITVGPRGWRSNAELFGDLRRAAAGLGADAVVRVDIDQYADESGFAHRIATGTAVRYR